MLEPISYRVGDIVVGWGSACSVDSWGLTYRIVDMDRGNGTLDLVACPLTGMPQVDHIVLSEDAVIPYDYWLSIKDQPDIVEKQYAIVRQQQILHMFYRAAAAQGGS